MLTVQVRHSVCPDKALPASSRQARKYNSLLQILLDEYDSEVSYESVTGIRTFGAKDGGLPPANASASGLG